MKKLACLIGSLLLSSSLMAAHSNRFSELYDEERREIYEFIKHGSIPEHGAESVRALNERGHARDWVEVTPSQPQGPFYPIIFPSESDYDLTRLGSGPQARGQVVLIQGQIMGQGGEVIKGATVEAWQANFWGKYNHQNDPNPNPIDPNFQYYASVKSDETGKYIFKTIVPGPYRADTNWIRPPHIHLIISAPGYASVTTQLYFDGNSFEGPTCQIDDRAVTGRDINAYNEADLLLSRVPATQRHRLIVRFRDVKIADENNKLGVFNIYLKKQR